jgi:hypothetical protein
MSQKVVSRATYWRRRVVVLAAGVAVLGLPVWAVNAALGGSRAPGQGPPRPSAGHVASAHSRAGHGHPRAPARETADPGGRPRARPAAVPRGASAAPSPGPGRRQTCPGRAVRLTIRSARHRYGPGEQVIFVVGAVSTSSRPCRLDLGSKFTSVVVASSGTPLWDSSSCLRGSGFWLVTLRRAAPVYLRVSWDRRTSLSGCTGEGAAVRSGSYTAAAFNGQIRSQATTFVLSGRGAARP